jgi:chondroitin 4-sulfotransferase 11
MISDKHKFIFIHITKTGGTSIQKLFQGKLKTHKFAKNYKKLIGDEKWNNYFKFAFVRNPWDKMVSQYFFIQKKHKGNYELTFREFILGFESFSQGNGEDISVEFNPVQLPWILDDDGNCLVDFIGKFENFQKDFDLVCDKIGVAQRQLPHKNKSKHKNYTEYYDEETRAIVAKQFAKDIEYFDYKFGE